MLQTCPEIHCDRADLHLHFHVTGLVREKDRHTDDHVVTTVTVGLGVLDIILKIQDRDVILLCQRMRQPIDIVHIGADHTDACHIMQMLIDIIHGKRHVQPCQLFHNAGTAL